MARRPSRTKVELGCAAAWRGFYDGDGRVAIAALMTEFNLYTSDPSNDAYQALREKGQRDVLLRIVQLIGLKPDHFVNDAWEDTDILDRAMRSTN